MQPAPSGIGLLSLVISQFPQARDLPETESHGGLLGRERQDLYLVMCLETGNGREQKQKTSVQEGNDGTVRWIGETISIKYTSTGRTMAAEASRSLLFLHCSTHDQLLCRR